jgi:hypothetical protein
VEARLNSVVKVGLSKVDRAVMVAREVGALLMVGIGLVSPLGSAFATTFDGELIGLANGNRDK